MTTCSFFELSALDRFLSPRMSFCFQKVPFLLLSPPSEVSSRSDRAPALASHSLHAVFRRPKVSRPHRARCQPEGQPVLHPASDPTARVCSPRFAASPTLAGAACFALCVLFSCCSLPCNRFVRIHVAMSPSFPPPGSHSWNSFACSPVSLPKQCGCPALCRILLSKNCLQPSGTFHYTGKHAPRQQCLHFCCNYIFNLLIINVLLI